METGFSKVLYIVALSLLSKGTRALSFEIFFVVQEEQTLTSTARTARSSSKALKSRDLRIDVLEQDMNQLELEVVEAR
jgi:hypothetical protein